MLDFNVWAFKTPVCFLWGVASKTKRHFHEKRCLWHFLTTADSITEITGTQDEELEVTDEDEKEEDKLTRPTAEHLRLTIIVLESKTWVYFLNLEKKMMASLKDLNHKI